MSPSAHIRGWCSDCGKETEQCQGPDHVGDNRCIRCSGGLYSVRYRICVNCGDAPVSTERKTSEGAEDSDLSASDRTKSAKI